MPGPADANLDELKRKARRRLVGAVVLALAAAVFVPMLLESDERPLGDDISVKIPPVDQGKFVNRLNSAPAQGKGAGKDSPGKAGAFPAPKAGDKPTDAKTSTTGDASDMPAAATALTNDAAKADKAGAASGSTAKSLGDAERRMLGSTSSAPPPAPAPASPSAPASALASTPAVPAAEATPASVVPTEPKPPVPAAETKKAVAVSAADSRKASSASVADTRKSAAAPSADAKKTASASPPKSAHGEFVVQLAAFSDDKGANALANRLKRSGHPAFTEPVTTSRGTLWRVRVGPYASRDEANAARDKLKREGQDGIVAARS